MKCGQGIMNVPKALPRAYPDVCQNHIDPTSTFRTLVLGREIPNRIATQKNRDRHAISRREDASSPEAINAEMSRYANAVNGAECPPEFQC
jgi:phage terminase Nu1 subunit (DNA packaging protein)